jgi:hypothetical protein
VIFSVFSRRKTKPNKTKQSQFQTRRRFGCGRIEIATVAALLRNDISDDLKKQSQFSGGETGISIYMKGTYEEIIAVWARKNKPNSKPNKANFRRGTY